MQASAAFATRAAFRSHVFHSSFSSTNGTLGTECDWLRTNGSVKPSRRLNFNLHGEWYYCCCWFTLQKYLLRMSFPPSLRGLFVLERSDARSKISSVLVKSDSSEKENRGRNRRRKYHSETIAFAVGNSTLALAAYHPINEWHRQRIMVHFEFDSLCLCCRPRCQFYPE